MFPRSQNTDDKGGATRPSLPGAHIITPFSLSPLGYVIWGQIVYTLSSAFQFFFCMKYHAIHMNF